MSEPATPAETRLFAGHVVLTGIAFAVQLAGRAAALALLARLGADAFGRLGAALAATALLGVVADLGLGNYLVLAIARDRAGARALVRATRLLRVAAGATALSVGVGVAAIFHARGGWPAEEPSTGIIVLVIAAAAIARVQTMVDRGVLRGLERMGLQAVVAAIDAVATAAAVAIAIATVGGIFAAALGWLAGAAVAAIVAAGMTSAALRASDRGGVAGDPAPTRPTEAAPGALALARTSVFFALNQLVAVALVETDALVVFSMRGDDETGLYRAASRVALLAMVPATVVTLAAGPVLARTLADDVGRFVRRAERVMMGSFALAVPLALAVAFIPGPILRLACGEVYADGASTALRILAIAWLVGHAPPNRWVVLETVGRAEVATAISAFGVMVNLAMTIALVPVAGIEGAAVATLSTQVILKIIDLAALTRLGLPTGAGALIRLSLVAGVVAGVLALERFVGTIGAGVAAIAVYAVALQVVLSPGDRPLAVLRDLRGRRTA